MHDFLNFSLTDQQVLSYLVGRTYFAKMPDLVFYFVSVGFDSSFPNVFALFRSESWGGFVNVTQASSREGFLAHLISVAVLGIPSGQLKLDFKGKVLSMTVRSAPRPCSVTFPPPPPVQSYSHHLSFAVIKGWYGESVVTVLASAYLFSPWPIFSPLARFRKWRSAPALRKQLEFFFFFFL